MLDKNGEEIQLSTLCTDDDVVPYSNKAKEAMLEENNIASDDEIDDGFQIEEADDLGDEIDLGELFGDFADENDDDNM